MSLLTVLMIVLRKILFAYKSSRGLNQIEKIDFKKPIHFDFKSKEIHYGDLLFWIPTLLMLKKSNVKISIDFGEKSELFTYNFLNDFNSGSVSVNDKGVQKISLANSINLEKKCIFFIY